jgi:hypothetical protein
MIQPNKYHEIRLKGLQFSATNRKVFRKSARVGIQSYTRHDKFPHPRDALVLDARF